MQGSIKRSLLFSLDFANTGKLDFLENLWQEYQKACQYFIDVGYETKTLPSYKHVKSYPFKCLRCGYEEDADIVGARNVLLRFTREHIVPLPAKPRPVEYFSIG